MYAKKYLHYIIEVWTRDMGFTVWIEVKEVNCFYVSRDLFKISIVIQLLKIIKYENDYNSNSKIYKGISRQ